MSKPVVFLTNSDHSCLVGEFLQQKFEIRCWPKEKQLTPELLKENVKGVFAILCTIANKIDLDVVHAAGETRVITIQDVSRLDVQTSLDGSSLKVISTISVGYDHIDVKGIMSRGIKIGYTPDVAKETVAELGVGLLLATSRRIVELYLAVHRNEWSSSNRLWMCGRGLENSTVGIVGCGRIGNSVARKLKAFNIGRLLYYSLIVEPEAEALGGELKSIDEVMRESDFIFVTMAQNEETKGIINRERINSMKPNAILVNIARGGLIDQKALIEALQNKKIAGAGLDVLDSEPIKSDHPLLKLSNVVITPHIGSGTFGCHRAMVELAAKNILAVLENREMPSELR